MYLLRWRFDYLAKTSRMGQWSRGATLEGDMACFQNKEGLVRAAVEGKYISESPTQRNGKLIKQYDTLILAECDGWDFVNFQWMAELHMRSDGKGSHHHVGLKMVTREQWVEVYAVNGLSKSIPRTDEDKIFHYETFGR